MIRHPHASYLAVAGLALAVAQGTPLNAQASGGWVPLHVGRGFSGDVRVMVVAGPDVYEIYFKNAGTSVVHFGFYVEGVQTEDDVPANGRIHLKPGSAVGPFLIHPRKATRGAIRVRAIEAVAGELDGPSDTDTQD